MLFRIDVINDDGSIDQTFEQETKMGFAKWFVTVALSNVSIMGKELQKFANGERIWMVNDVNPEGLKCGITFNLVSDDSVGDVLWSEKSESYVIVFNAKTIHCSKTFAPFKRKLTETIKKHDVVLTEQK